MYAESSKWCFVPNCGNTSINASQVNIHESTYVDAPNTRNTPKFGSANIFTRGKLFEVAFTKSLEVMLVNVRLVFSKVLFLAPCRKLIEIYGHPQKSTEIHGYPQKSTDIHPQKSKWVYSEIHQLFTPRLRISKVTSNLQLEVMVSALLVISFLTTLSSASICREKQYFNYELQQCMNCTDCKDGTMVLRPCDIHRDTHCSPISELLKTMGTGNPHRHKHNKYHQRREHSEDVVWRYGSDITKEDNMEEQQAAALEVASSEAPFSNAETLVWDWQAVALTSAVFACILFFLVITLYSLHQAKQWRRLKENFEAGDTRRNRESREQIKIENTAKKYNIEMKKEKK
ncbi:hypothetical protein NQ315_003885 [Exocentrus adspersus]|uniref:TNFR-Cys domain-containing protein n=1 Tax=Exocentrus adspersus TaxID=1586481 RepID=A0AAV8W0A5_9CUCU|nr:hypothetical protein NQ315_003885 [Exocentrus adspersus]